VRASTSVIRELAGRGEIAGGWWIWALRGVANSRGWHGTGAGALARYAALADEVNAACDDGRIPCGPPHDSLAPPLHRSDLAPIAAATLRAALYVVRMEGAAVDTPASFAPPDQLALFRLVTRTRPAVPADATRRHPGLDAVALAYRIGVPVLSIAALGVLAWRGRRLAAPGVLALAALATLFATRVALIGVIEVTSFPAVNPVHLAAAYPVWLAFCGLAIAMGVEARGGPTVSRPGSPP
jgi:hypothetical protein